MKILKKWKLMWLEWQISKSIIRLERLIHTYNTNVLDLELNYTVYDNRPTREDLNKHLH